VNWLRLLLFLVCLDPGIALAGCSWYAEKDPGLRINWIDSHVVMGFRGVVNLGGGKRFPIEVACSNGYMVCGWMSRPTTGIEYEGDLVHIEESGDSRYIVSYLGRVAWYEFEHSLRDDAELFSSLDGFWKKSPECAASGWFE
jgi:hypothetical protein